MMTDQIGGLLSERFERYEIEPAAFGHYEHLVVAYEMLNRYDFIEATSKVASTIKEMARRAGAPKKYNATITFAFMSLIAEHKSKADFHNLKHFLSANPALLEKDVLKRWYTDSRLHSAQARTQFLLPDKTCT